MPGAEVDNDDRGGVSVPVAALLLHDETFLPSGTVQVVELREGLIGGKLGVR